MKVVVYSNDDDDAIILPLKLEDSKKALYFSEVGGRDIEEYDRTVMRLDEGLIITLRGFRVSGDIVV